MTSVMQALDWTRTLPGVAALLAFALLLAAVGGWEIGAGRLPRWARGRWKWPLGDNLSRQVVALQGWTAILLAVSLLAATLGNLIPRTGSQVGLITVAVSLLLAGSGTFTWSLLQSRRA